MLAQQFATTAALSASALVLGAAVPVSGAQNGAPTQHVIVVVQENRTVDNLFQGFPGADTQSFGFDSHGNKVKLTALPLGAPYDPNHSHGSFVTACNAATFTLCRMNGFDKVACFACPVDTSYTYVNPSDIVPYTYLAKQYAFADHVLQPNEGPSLPAHIYLIAGQAGTPGSHWYVAENPLQETGAQNCLALANHSVLQIDMTTPYPGVEGRAISPCVDPPTILDELDRAHIEWRYYTPGPGWMWTAPFAVRHLLTSPADRARVIVPETTIFGDIRSHRLQPVSFVIPNLHNSDHPELGNPNGGPDWVASIVNAIGIDAVYWPNTTILVVWDDWGGWFDHYVPVHAMNPFGLVFNPNEYGFRVPLLAIGAHAKVGYISHRLRSAVAILRYIEDTYGLPSLGELDAQTDNLSDMFAPLAPPRPFRLIPTPGVTIQDLVSRPRDPRPIDDE